MPRIERFLLSQYQPVLSKYNKAHKSMNDLQALLMLCLVYLTTTTVKLSKLD